MAVTPDRPDGRPAGQPDEDDRADVTDVDAAFVSSVLASTGAVGPVPEDVARRVEAALASAAAGTMARGVVPLPARRDARQVSTGPALLVAAAVVGVLTLGGLALAAGGATEGPSVAGAGAASAESAAEAATDTTVEDDAAAGAAAGTAPRAGGAPTVLASGRDYTSTDLAPRVRELVRAGSPAAALGAPTAEQEAGGGAPEVLSRAAGGSVAPALSSLQDPGRLQACVEELAAGNPTLSPVTVDLATFAGEPAALVVLGRPGADRVDAWVVGGGCSPGDAQVRYFSAVALE